MQEGAMDETKHAGGKRAKERNHATTPSERTTDAERRNGPTMVGWAGNRRTLTEWTDACASLCLVGPFSQGDACAKLELSQKIFNFTVRETSRVGSKRTFEPNDGRWKRTHAQSQGVRNERRNGRGGRLDVRRNEAKRHALIDGGRSSATRHLAFERDERERQRTFTNARTDRRGRLRCVRVQEDQDLKIKVGLDVLRRNVYAQIRENNWTLSTDMRGSWHVSYDL
mmetsp:Transcript_9854/g.35017  ORF Transcript_9854/g.35017 Transcript_9854/m.35017 type:complete len:226 (+) Transcript_9854:111-788(+)